jgi:hypothetical protein
MADHFVQIFEAIYMRKRSFTSLTDWKTLPFQQQGQNVIQKLLTVASDIPHLLERFDALYQESGSERELAAMALYTDFSNTRRRVDGSFKLTDTTAPAYWSVVHGEADSNFRFTNLASANIYLNYWLFCSICYIHLHLLQVRHGASDPSYPTGDSSPEAAPLDRAVEYATNIYRSMDFVLQDEMRMQGPASRILTARIGYDILKFDGPRSASKLNNFQHVMLRFEKLGFKIPSLPGDRPFWSINTGKV